MSRFARPVAAFCLTGFAAFCGHLPSFATPAKAVAPQVVSLAHYLPAGVEYDPEIPPPAEILGWEVGTWHVTPEALVRYMEVLASRSDRVRIDLQGRTHEGRPQVLVTLTSAANQDRLEEIRTARLAADGPPEGAPAVVWLGYSIHGNEASGSNASLLTAYHLAAARGPEIEALLDEVVVLIDPCLNPDGLGRFATWANMHRGRQPVGRGIHREHNEVWPGGRTNHYWFDLNRDWLLLQHPESVHRVKTLWRWRPDLSGDYHEMGSDQTYFFQPGVPSRQNPLTPDRNLQLTREIAAFHAEALDAEGRLYFSEETFDDFYPGKGSTYPDLVGGLGVLFEQASVRGHRRDTENGTLTFPFAVHNQFLTSLSMIDAGRAKREALHEYRREFDRGSRAAASRDALGGYVFGDGGDPARAWHLVEILEGHGIEVYRLARGIEVGGDRFAPESAFLVPVEQDRYRLIKALFEKRTAFEDSTFYDISAWTLPLAFGLPEAGLGRRVWAKNLLGEAVTSSALKAASKAPVAASSPYAYLIDWSGYYAPAAVYALQRGGYRPRVAKRPFEAETPDGRRAFAAGTVVVPTAGASPALTEHMRRFAREGGVAIHPVASGLTPNGIDLGSPQSRPLKTPKPLLLVGPGVSGYAAGEIWHLLDHRMGIELPLVEVERLRNLDLDRFTHLLMVDGEYGRIDEDTLAAILRWVRRGGVVVASGRAAAWAGDSLLTLETEGLSGETGGGDEDSRWRAYAEFDQERQAERISGAIFETELDLTHPLVFGYRASRLPVFRSGTAVLEAGSDPYAAPVRYTSDPLLAGYASEERQRQLAGTPALVAQRVGRGTVVRLAGRANFRGFWFGTNKLYLNALFFAPLLDATEPPERWR
ncbi:MAG: M14 family metallopeptidase [Acidobacteriota bacterium]